MAHPGVCILACLGMVALGPALPQSQMPQPCPAPNSVPGYCALGVERAEDDQNSCPQSPGGARSWNPGLLGGGTGWALGTGELPSPLEPRAWPSPRVPACWGRPGLADSTGCVLGWLWMRAWHSLQLILLCRPISSACLGSQPPWLSLPSSMYCRYHLGLGERQALVAGLRG